MFTFTVTLSAPYDQPVTMSFCTVDGTAKSGEDCVAKSGALTSAHGETTKTITIEGDSKREATEYFYLDLFDNSGNFAQRQLSRPQQSTPSGSRSPPAG